MAIRNHLVFLACLVILAVAASKDAGHFRNVRPAGKGKILEKHNAKEKMQKAIKQAPVPPTPKSVAFNCMKENFEDVGECCKDAPFDLFNREAHQRCFDNYIQLNQITSKSMEGVREYNLNIWQTGANNALDLLTTVQVQKRENLTCHAECLFRRHGLMISDTMLNYEAIAEYFKKTTDVISRRLVLNAVSECSKIMPAFLFNLKFMDACNPHAFLFAQCVLKEVLVYCELPPISKEGAGNFDEHCHRQRKVILGCDIMKTSSSETFKAAGMPAVVKSDLNPSVAAFYMGPGMPGMNFTAPAVTSVITGTGFNTTKF